MKEAWQTTSCIDLQQWVHNEVLIALMDNTLFAPFIALLSLRRPYRRRCWGALRLPQHPNARPTCITVARAPLDPDAEDASKSEQEFFLVGDDTGYVCCFLTVHGMPEADVRLSVHYPGHARIQNVGKYQSCMVSKLPWCRYGRSPRARWMMS